MSKSWLYEKFFFLFALILNYINLMLLLANTKAKYLIGGFNKN